MLAVGDIAEQFLRRIGVTKERVSTFVKKDCGCKKRQEALNEAGYRWQGRLYIPVRFVLYYWQELRAGINRIRYSRLSQRLHMACHYIKMAIQVLLFDR